MASILGDIGSMLGAANGVTATNSTSRKGNTELNMEDFLQLMIVQLTNQTIDDTMDTSEMMNQLVQMQMITAITNLTDTSIQTYANSLVGQWVTVGLVNGNTLEERFTQIMSTGTYNGEQVIFCRDGNMYYLSQIMAVGELPDEDGNYHYTDMVQSSGCNCGSGGVSGSGSTGGTSDPSEEGPDINVDSDLIPEFGIDAEDEDAVQPGDTGGDNTVPDENNAYNPEYDGSQGADLDP